MMGLRIRDAQGEIILDSTTRTPKLVFTFDLQTSIRNSMTYTGLKVNPMRLIPFVQQGFITYDILRGQQALNLLPVITTVPQLSRVSSSNDNLLRVFKDPNRSGRGSAIFARHTWYRDHLGRTITDYPLVRFNIYDVGVRE